MTDILSQITKIIKEIVGDNNTNVFTTKSATYDTFPVHSTHNQIVIRPLSQLISLPMQTKRHIFSDAYQDQKKYHNPDAPVRKILDVATKLVTSKYGKQRSMRWRDQMYDLMNQIVRIEGIKGLFSGSRPILEIKESSRENDFEIDEELFVIFYNYKFKIGIRSLKFGEPAELLDNWEISEEYAILFSTLKEVYNNQFYKKAQQISDLFIWSDAAIDSFQESFIKHTLSHAINSVEPRKNYRGVIVLLGSITENNDSLLPKPSSFERLCLQRAIGRVRIIYSPSKVYVKSDIMKSKALTLERLEETDFFENLEVRLIDILGEHTNILSPNVSEIIHESTQHLVDKSSFSLISNTWNATWHESLEIDGEHIMS